MLHYLIMIVEKNYNDTLHIQDDLGSVPEAAKVKWVHQGLCYEGLSAWGLKHSNKMLHNAHGLLQDM